VTREPFPSTVLRICVVGSGWHFTSGISYYTCRLVGALDGSHEVSALLLRRLIPRWLYPGKARVGTPLHRLTYPKNVPVFDGIDWFWGLSLWRAMRFLKRERPEVLVLQWWTGAVLHTYWALTHLARRRGIAVIVEFHETQDTGEARLPLAGRYLRALARRVLANTDAVLVHSEFDRGQIRELFAIGTKPVGIAPHGPYDHHLPAKAGPSGEPDVTRLLFFGTIRPYKGLEHLVAAFDLMTEEQARGFRLTIVGETWEGWGHPLAQARLSRHKDRITIVNRYVDDDEVTSHFGAADVVVLPYTRSSSSGPLHIAMAHGLPVVLTDVGGLRDAAGGYDGIVWTPAAQPEELRDALLAAGELRMRRYDDPRSWNDTVEALEALIAALTPARVASP
jgi:glycosyltransferase involved in cell wall biosynthesis